jgi:hypothetical protein
LKETFAWMDAHWFGAPHYVRLDGRPLVLNFGPIYVRDAAVWNAAREGHSARPLLFGLHHLWKQAGADGGFTWVHHEPWEPPFTPESTRRRLGEVFRYFSADPAEVIVSAYPGFNDVYEEHERHRELDHRGGETLRETLAAATEGPWRVVQLVTWNDYGEGTIIEPTHEFGYTFLEIIQAARKKEWGAAFPFTPDDLRLPARLYALRKGGVVPPSETDRVAELLRQGSCAAAAREIDRLERAR